jgi:Uma2 family endonuclease
MVIDDNIYSADDLWELAHRPEYANLRLELSEGKLIIMTPVGEDHGRRTIRLGRYVDIFAEENDLGYCTTETGYILYQDEEGRDVVRAPDVAFVVKNRTQEQPSPKYVPFAPDLAVEFVSPNDDAEDIEKKVQEYLRGGTRMVWVLYSATRSVTVHTPDGIYRVTADGTLDGGDVLPGFSLPLTKIFGVTDKKGE